jgi:hypothetical protein
MDPQNALIFSLSYHVSFQHVIYELDVLMVNQHVQTSLMEYPITAVVQFSP